MQTMKLAAAAAALSVVLAAGSTEAVTVITKAIPGGPFSADNWFGGLPVLALDKADIYNFTFTLVPPIDGDTQTQVQAQIETKLGGSPEPIQFDLYSGTPSGSYTFLQTSPVSTSSFLALDLTPGNYFIQITPAYIAVNGEVDSGSVVTAVPEPAAWALMIVGLGAIGGALRARPRPVSAEA
jgi:hypothetical protein